MLQWAANVHNSPCIMVRPDAGTPTCAREELEQSALPQTRPHLNGMCMRLVFPSKLSCNWRWSELGVVLIVIKMKSFLINTICTGGCRLFCLCPPCPWLFILIGKWRQIASTCHRPVALHSGISCLMSVGALIWCEYLQHQLTISWWSSSGEPFGSFRNHYFGDSIEIGTGADFVRVP